MRPLSPVVLGILAACPAEPADTGGSSTSGIPPVAETGAADPTTGGVDETDSAGTTSGTTTTDASTGATTGAPPADCPPEVTCVDSFPFTDMRDTAREGAAVLDGYGCAPDTDESGPELVYRVTVPEAGFLSAAVYSEEGVDVDVHILSALDAASCLDRGDLHARADVPAGVTWIVADTYAADGVPRVGGFRLDIGFLAPSSGGCAVEVGEMARVGDGGDHLAMPATGPIVREAHLVTADEPPPYPASASDELAGHYALSQAVTGLVMHRGEAWAPLEGGDFYGAGIGDPDDLPSLHEGWYVNMYWTSAARPAKGTRMILRDPNGSRAVVVAAGYETGPGNLEHIGGTPEESHFYLGTSHLDVLELGIAVDQSLAFGPRVCR